MPADDGGERGAAKPKQRANLMTFFLPAGGCIFGFGFDSGRGVGQGARRGLRRVGEQGGRICGGY